MRETRVVGCLARRIMRYEYQWLVADSGRARASELG